MIRCWLCSHKGEPYCDADGECCAECGHTEFDYIDPQEADSPEVAGESVEAPRLEEVA